ncbi:aminotransferase class V-fold PLP-dependent enzyme [Microbacterium azadirachtae]|uniref:2-aminoethylphosphonate--pyruvate transaminase n=1 Tax=Microbacterium azadirachtae TaxID=582680 RepID=A0A0F0KZQ7_9MICO|nr:aminotransferase class V-fold PLP-dependent enzyme [Microbacterium azadirachtae]KJL25605.1 2-aminoethylphosphonate--pyruvate transaminase [Microbacterium azadirachtae]SDL30963.1 aspartate aminotransferase [Microbacterium azadirachtae]SEF61067.1 aspartate aminotransferase [Microbacterium azadirachtae]SEF61668.1 aspartate aminotransferase [Microbacterium azadirachtae]
MDLPHDDVDPDGLLEYSVVFTDRSLNHMSARFVAVMQDIQADLRAAYGATTTAVVPGGGTYAMESVARQLATGRRCLIVRNGLFSYRWSQILEAGDIARSTVVCTARPDSDDVQAAWAPAPIDEVVAAIRAQRSDVVFAPHVETAAGILLPDDYVRTLAEAVHQVGGLLVLDAIASGALWVDMAALGVDVLISAPQKGWSGSPGAGYVMLNEAGRDAVSSRTSSSFALDLAKWLWISEEYRDGRAPYHATMPTDTLRHNAVLMAETRERGFEALRSAQWDLGARVRALLAERGLPSVAAAGFASPTVAVVHTSDPGLRTGARFREQGLQIAAGVPLHCGEPEAFSTFRIGLFGLDKLADVDGTVQRLADALDRIGR